MECPNRCDRYTKSIDEIFAAGKKHKDKLLALIEVSEKQKSKISSLREEKNSLLDKVDQMELDDKCRVELVIKMTNEQRALKIELRDVRMVLIEQEELIREKTENQDTNEFLKIKMKDLEDELQLKDIKISNLEVLVKEKTILEKTLESEINSAGKDEEDLEAKIKFLEADIMKKKEKEISDKNVRDVLFKRMDILSESRKCNLEKLKEKITNMKQKRFPKCWYGIQCQRRFCHYDHRNVYRKENRSFKKPESQSKFFENVSTDYLCDQCGKILQNFEMYMKHIQNHNEEISQKEQQNFKCRECFLVFDIRSDLNDHLIQNHEDMDMECEVCGKFFVSRKELNHHRKNHDSIETEIVDLNKMLQGLLNAKEEASIVKKIQLPDC